MNTLDTNQNEKNRILKLHLQEQTSSSASGAYETPKAFSSHGDLTNTSRGEGLVGVELTLDLPNEVDITDGGLNAFEDMDLGGCSSCGEYHDGPCDDLEMGDESIDVNTPMEELLTLDDFIEDEGKSDVIPDTLLSLFGDVNIGGDLEIEMDEEPKKLRGSRKFRK